MRRPSKDSLDITMLAFLVLAPLGYLAMHMLFLAIR